MMLILIKKLNNMSFVFYVSMILVNFYFVYSDDQFETNVCNQNYYAKPICLDKISSYKCKCDPGFIWNGEMCVSTALNSYYEFNEKSTNSYVFLEKTFPKLTSLTISTWLQIHNYTTSKPSSLLITKHKKQQRAVYYDANLKDIRTLFSYSLDNFINVLQCQVSSTQRAKNENTKKILTQLHITISVFNISCSHNFAHTYSNGSYWLHLAFTWDSSNGEINIYVNGQLKSTCTNIAIHKVLNTAGVFVLGQSHRESLFHKQSKFDISTSSSSSNKKNGEINLDTFMNTNEVDSGVDDEFENYNIDDSDNGNDYSSNSKNKENQNPKFDEHTSFIGRLFNFNVWNHVKSSKSIHSLFNDCMLSYCGNATQWSDFRQGTRGQVKMKWPTELLWKKECFSDKYQQDSCQKFCNQEIGPICRESVEKNLRWPLTKANITSKLKCFPNTNDTHLLNKTNKYAYRHCSLNSNSNNNNNNYNYDNYDLNENSKKIIFLNGISNNVNGLNEINGYSSKQISIWQTVNINECIQEPFVNLRNQVYLFHTTDNFDETQIIVYLERLYDLTVKNIRSSAQRTIFDVSTVIDTIFYLINAQHQIIKRNLDANFNLAYPDYEDTIKFTKHILAIIDMLLGLTKDNGIWGASLPIGSESIRIIDIIKQLSASIFDFQRLNHINNRDEDDDIDLSRVRVINKNLVNKNSSHAKNRVDILNTLPSYVLIDIKFQYITFRQELLFTQEQMPLNFYFPEKKNPDQTQQNKSKKNKNPKDKDKKKSKSSKQKTTNSFNNNLKSSLLNQQTTTSMSTPFDLFPDLDYQTTIQETTTSNQPDRYHFSSSYNLMPSIYLGHVLFNEHNLILPLQNKTHNKNIDPYALLTVYYSGIETILPNHNKTFRARDNNINSIVITVDLIGVNGPVKLNQSNYNKTLDKPISVHYTYLNSFNISDTRCVVLEEVYENNKRFRWSRQACTVKEKSLKTTTCECFSFGTYSITNDLYDPEWLPVIIENIPLMAPSYFGCIVVSLFGIATYACLTYLKTKSTTTSIHKNLCISICLSQWIIMISLTRFNFDQTLCNMFGILNHYLLFVVFAWLMNEAFNLYITITYAAHQSSPINDTGSQWRFYLLGYLLPAVIVFVLFITKSKEYYDKKLCWFNLDHLWINVSPMISMLAVSILVMIFSAKEHTESSYTKNEKANKLIANHTKAVWTQIVLLSLCWTFGIMSFILIGPVVKYLYAFLNCLQGSFLFIFYFLLNEEVRKYLRDRKKKKRLKSKEKYFNTSIGITDTNINKHDEKLEEAFEEEDDDDDDDDDDEEDDDGMYDFETGNGTEQNNDANNQQHSTNQEENNDKSYSNVHNYPSRSDNFNRELSYQSDNPDVFSLSCPPAFNPKGSLKRYNNNSSSAAIPKNVKFENTKSKIPTTTTSTTLTTSNQSNATTPVKSPKPSMTSSVDFPTANASNKMNFYENQMSLDLGTTSMTATGTSPTTPTLLWPQQKKKLSFRNAYNKQNTNINGSGAELYDTNEEKVTVL